VFTARYGLNLLIMYINPSEPSGHCMYHQFDTQQFYVLPSGVPTNFFRGGSPNSVEDREDGDLGVVAP